MKKRGKPPDFAVPEGSRYRIVHGMPKRTSKKRKSKKGKRARTSKASDVNQLAASIVESATTGDKNPAAVSLGRLGGLKGGKARADKLTAEQRSEIARNAAKARWKKEGA